MSIEVDILIVLARPRVCQPSEREKGDGGRFQNENDPRPQFRT